MNVNNAQHPEQAQPLDDQSSPGRVHERVANGPDADSMRPQPNTDRPPKSPLVAMFAFGDAAKVKVEKATQKGTAADVVMFHQVTGSAASAMDRRLTVAADQSASPPAAPTKAGIRQPNYPAPQPPGAPRAERGPPRKPLPQVPAEIQTLGAASKKGPVLTPEEFIELAKQHKAPENAIVTGNLELKASEKLKLPANLTVKGSLKLYGDIDLAKDLKVEKFLRIENPTLKSLPSGITVGGACFLEKCYKLTNVPDDLKAEFIFQPQVPSAPAQPQLAEEVTNNKPAVKTEDRTIYVNSHEDLLALAGEANKRIRENGQSINIKSCLSFAVIKNGRVTEIPMQLIGIEGQNTGNLTIQSPGWQAIYDADKSKDKSQAYKAFQDISVNICLLKMYFE